MNDDSDRVSPRSTTRRYDSVEAFMLEIQVECWMEDNLSSEEIENLNILLEKI